MSNFILNDLSSIKLASLLFAHIFKIRLLQVQSFFYEKHQGYSEEDLLHDYRKHVYGLIFQRNAMTQIDYQSRY